MNFSITLKILDKTIKLKVKNCQSEQQAIDKAKLFVLHNIEITRVDKHDDNMDFLKSIFNMK